MTFSGLHVYIVAVMTADSIVGDYNHHRVISSQQLCSIDLQQGAPPPHLSQHHDDAVGVQEARGVPLVQAHLGLHGCPGSASEVVFVHLRAGGLKVAQTPELRET